jgi:hypothetical protein
VNTVERDQRRAANEVDSGWGDLGERHPRILQVALLNAAAYGKKRDFLHHESTPIQSVGYATARKRTAVEDVGWARSDASGANLERVRSTQSGR